MRFCDFFIEYKIGLKGMKNSIPFSEFSLYRKIVIIVLFAVMVAALVFSVLHITIAVAILLGIGILLSIIVFAIDSRKENLQKMLTNNYIPYSEKRMGMILSLLNNYDIKATDTNTLDLLICEAKKSQIQCDYFLPLKKPFKTLGAIIIPFVIFAIKKISETISETATVEEIFSMFLTIIFTIICIFSVLLAIVPLLKELFYRDYNKYNELLSDLNQVKIFYSKNIHST